MNKPMYPDDGGLKEQVRPFNEGFSGFQLLRERFAPARHDDRDFVTKSFPHLFLLVRRKDGHGGHFRLFADRPGRGWMVHQWLQQGGGAPGWAWHRVWNFALFAVHHIGPGKATDPEGWHVTFANLKCEKIHRGITLKWSLADTFRAKPVRR